MEIEMAALGEPQPLLDASDVGAQRIRAAQASVRANGFLILSGVCHRVESINSNGRLYRRDVVEREVISFTEQYLLCGAALGECEHPSADSPHFRSINTANASHRFLDLFWRGDDLMATIQVMHHNPAGAAVRDLYLSGERAALASRGWATLMTDPATGIVTVGNDYSLITFDCVRHPAFGEYLEPVAQRCGALAALHVCRGRALHWLERREHPPAWPFGPGQCVLGVQLWPDAAVVPAVDLMRHDPRFRARMRCFLLCHTHLGAPLPAPLLAAVAAFAAHAAAQELLCGFLRGFVASAERVRVPPSRLCSRPAQQPSAAWAPLRLRSRSRGGARTQRTRRAAATRAAEAAAAGGADGDAQMVMMAADAPQLLAAEAQDESSVDSSPSPPLCCPSPRLCPERALRRGAAAMRSGARAAMRHLRRQQQPPPPYEAIVEDDVAHDGHAAAPLPLWLQLDDSGDEQIESPRFAGLEL